MSDTDLFGVGILSPLPVANCEPGKRRTKANGYAAPPGSGPAGETCRTCAHYAHKGGGSRRYPGCALIHWRWTRGPGTDIKAKSPACRMWEGNQ